MKPSSRLTLSPAARATRVASSAAGGLAAALMLVPAVVLGRYYLSADLSLVDLGALCEARRRLQALDGWWLSPALGNGEPLLANPQMQLMYPLRWIAMLLDPDWGLTLSVALHVGIAAAGAAWLARTFRAGVMLAACAGLAYAFSGTVASQVSRSTYLVGAAWLPVMWAAGRRVLQRRDDGHAATMLWASSLAALLGADPQAFGVGACALGLEGAALMLRSASRGARSLGRTAWLMAAALLASMVQWLPAFAEMALTPRAAGFTTGTGMHWSFTPVEWLGAIAPGILQRPVQPDANLWSAFSSIAMPWVPSAYVGPLLLALACAGAWLRPARPAAILGAGFLVLAVGDALPVFPWLWRVFPPVQFFRYPAKYLVAVNLAVMVAGTVSLRSWLRTRRGRRVLALACAASGLGALAVLVVVKLREADVDSLTVLQAVAGLPTPWPSPAHMLERALLQGLVPVVVAVLVLASPRLAPLLPLVVAVDVAVAAPAVLHLGGTLAGATSPLRALRSPDGRTAPVLCQDPELAGLQFSVSQEAGPWPQVALARYVGLPALNACDGIPAAMSYSLLQPGTNEALVSAMSAGNAAAARALGCGYVVSLRPPAGATSVPLPGFPGNGAVGVFAVRSPVPEAFRAAAPHLVASQAGVLRELFVNQDADAALSVVDDPLGRLPPGAVLGDGRGVAGLELDWPVRHQADLAVGGSGAAVVGLRTAFHVGWRAWQAGEELPVVRAAGTHVAAVVADVARGPVQFRYSPPRLGWGALLSLAGLAMLLLARRQASMGAKRAVK